MSVCEKENIADPIDILRLLSTKIVTVRPLDAEAESSAIEGETNLQRVNKWNIV